MATNNITLDQIKRMPTNEVLKKMSEFPYASQWSQPTWKWIAENHSILEVTASLNGRGNAQSYFKHLNRCR